MGQVSPKFRRTTGGYGHWCPGCKEMHVIPDRWQFNGNLDRATFSPSVKITGKQTAKDGKGNWTGEWVCDANGKALDECCHYILTDGVLNFCGDCTHSMAGKSVPLPVLPEWMTDE